MSSYMMPGVYIKGSHNSINNHDGFKKWLDGGNSSCESLPVVVDFESVKFRDVGLGFGVHSNSDLAFSALSDPNSIRVVVSNDTDQKIVRYVGNAIAYVEDEFIGCIADDVTLWQLFQRIRDLVQYQISIDW